MLEATRTGRSGVGRRSGSRSRWFRRYLLRSCGAHRHGEELGSHQSRHGLLSGLPVLWADGGAHRQELGAQRPVGVGVVALHRTCDPSSRLGPRQGEPSPVGRAVNGRLVFVLASAGNRSRSSDPSGWGLTLVRRSSRSTGRGGIVGSTSCEARPAYAIVAAPSRNPMLTRALAVTRWA